MHNVSPGMHPRAFNGMFLEAYSLRQNHPERMVDPSHFVRRLTIGNHVAHDGLYRLSHFDFEPASRLPWSAFTPAHFTINVCEVIPSPPIGENFPSQLFAGLGRHTILKSKHNLLSCTPCFRNFGIPTRGSFGAYSLYIVSLTM